MARRSPLIVVVLDACFLILLRDTGRLGLLEVVREPLEWSYYVPDVVFIEATDVKPAGTAVEDLVSDGTVSRCTAPAPLCETLSVRNPRLGRGEVEALAYAITEKDHGEDVIVVTDDVRAERVAERLGLEIVSTLDFLGNCNTVGVMSEGDIKQYLDVLRNHSFEVSEERLREFLASIGSS